MVELALPPNNHCLKMPPQSTVSEQCNRWSRDRGTQTQEDKWDRTKKLCATSAPVWYSYLKSVKKTAICKSSRTRHFETPACYLKIYSFSQCAPGLCTCLPRSPLSPESSSRLQRLQQTIHDTGFIILCKHRINTQHQQHVNKSFINYYFLYCDSHPHLNFLVISHQWFYSHFHLKVAVIGGFALTSTYLCFSQTPQQTHRQGGCPRGHIGKLANPDCWWPSSATVPATHCIYNTPVQERRTHSN